MSKSDENLVNEVADALHSPLMEYVDRYVNGGVIEIFEGDCPDVRSLRPQKACPRLARGSVKVVGGDISFHADVEMTGVPGWFLVRSTLGPFLFGTVGLINTGAVMALNSIQFTFGAVLNGGIRLSGHHHRGAYSKWLLVMPQEVSEAVYGQH
jgi:hypothetical protein